MFGKTMKYQIMYSNVQHVMCSEQIMASKRKAYRHVMLIFTAMLPEAQGKQLAQLLCMLPPPLDVAYHILPDSDGW